MTLDAASLAHLASWTGRQETLHDHISAAPLRGLAALLDQAPADTGPGTPLPPLAHWLFFLPTHRQSEIGADGHPQRGGFLPPVPLPRRMWAGGRLQWHGAPLVVGDAVRRSSTIASVTHKAGRSGELVFVLVKHELHGPQGLALSEEHDIVYRSAAQPGEVAPTPAAAPDVAAFGRTITPDPVLLFRYSALTFNGHRIHYDHPYVTQVEGYPGLIVHGPLMATLLAQLAAAQHPGRALSRFEFRALKPVFDTAPFGIHGRPDGPGHSALWVRDPAGHLAMQASAQFD
jgi:3-methylfumaryl-CoA hydratase